jgi:hypothetical protein
MTIAKDACISAEPPLRRRDAMHAAYEIRFSNGFDPIPAYAAGAPINVVNPKH